MQGKVVTARYGRKNPDNLYIKLKNGSVWRYHKPLPEMARLDLIARIKFNDDVVRLKHWIRVGEAA